jgi:hypothetical protein
VVIVRCTRKLLTVLGRPAAQLPAPAPDGEDWYANLVRLDRRQCLLLTHTATLFTIFEPAATAPALRSTGRLVTGLIARELRNEALPPHTFGALDPADVQTAATADRSVLGCMNDMTFRCEYTITLDGGLPNTNLAELNRSLRRNINSARSYRQPIDLTTERLTNHP